MFKIKKGGIHPEDNKNRTARKTIEFMPLPVTLTIPLKQHIGEICMPVVKKGDLVKKGQIIATIPNDIAPPIHSSTSGKVLDIGNYPHPIFGISQSVLIESDGKDEWQENLLCQRNYENLSVKELVDIIYQNGIVGMGGAAFPTHTKLKPPKDKKIDTLIVNGAECEPYLTADYRIMLEYPDQVIKGCKIIMKILDIQHCIIGIEDNKPQAIFILKRLYKRNWNKNSYPQNTLPARRRENDDQCHYWTRNTIR